MGKEGALDILVFPFPGDWLSWQRDGFRHRTSHLVEKLSQHPRIGKILIVNNPVSVPRVIKASLLRQQWMVKGEQLAILEGMVLLHRVAEETYTLTNFKLLPYDDRVRFSKIVNTAFLSSILRRDLPPALDRLGMHNLIVWVSDPLKMLVASDVSSRLVVFDAIDNWLYHPQKLYVRDRVAQAYEQIPRQADVIFAVSEELRNYFSKNHPRVYLVPNAVDAERFNVIDKRPPSDCQVLNRPLVGYVGTIQERVDVELLIYLAKRYASFSFALVGPVRASGHAKALARYPNVHLLGRRHYREIPSYLQTFDICIIPHLVDTFSRSMNPLKLYEYLAAGKPVITTPIPLPEDIKGVVHVAGTKEAFAELLTKVLREDHHHLAEERRAIAKKHSWTRRASEMMRILHEQL